MVAQIFKLRAKFAGEDSVEVSHVILHDLHVFETFMMLIVMYGYSTSVT